MLTALDGFPNLTEEVGQRLRVGDLASWCQSNKSAWLRLRPQLQRRRDYCAWLYQEARYQQQLMLDVWQQKTKCRTYVSPYQSTYPMFPAHWPVWPLNSELEFGYQAQSSFCVCLDRAQQRYLLGLCVHHDGVYFEAHHPSLPVSVQTQPGGLLWNRQVSKGKPKTKLQPTDEAQALARMAAVVHLCLVEKLRFTYGRLRSLPAELSSQVRTVCYTEIVHAALQALY